MDSPERTTIIVRPSPSVADSIARTALWVAYRLLRIWWLLRRPHHDGAVVAVWLGSRVLMVRHSYRGRLGWPGGGMEPGERAVDAAVRELDEELGLRVPCESLVFRGEVMERWEKRFDHARIFELRLTAVPTLHPDGREVIVAEFMTPAEALRLPRFRSSPPICGHTAPVPERETRSFGLRRDGCHGNTPVAQLS
jgi:8-oxo-dGTP diphosphatase